MEIKKIADLPVLEAAGEATNVLVEDGGEAKRIPVSALGSSGGGLPSGGESHQMLVTNEDAETVWEERTHYKSQERISLVCDEENEFNISNEDGDVVLYHAYGGSFGPGAHNQYYIEYTDMYGDDMRAYLTKAEHGGNMTLVNDSNASSECIYVIDDILGDSVTINGHTFTNYGIYAPSSIYVINQGGDHESVELNEIVGVSYHQLDRNYLPDDAVLPEGGAANMMLVTDADGNAVWEEKIPTTGGADIVPESTVTVNEDMGSVPFLEPLGGEVDIGETYKVAYNGTEYACEAKTFSMEGVTYAALGNLGAMTENESDMTDDPFLFISFPAEVAAEQGFYAMLLPIDGSTEMTLHIWNASVKIDNSALDMDWIAKYDNVGETIVAETIGRGINVECPGADTAFFVEGATFIAYVDNKRYDPTVVNYEGTLAAGNLGLAAEGAPGNNEPFYVTTLATGGLLFSWGATGDMDTSHTVSAYQTGSSQRVANQKVPDAFFPDIRPFYVNVTYKSDGSVADKTYDEIYGAHNANRVVCCKLMSGGVEYVLYYTGVDQAKAWFFAHRGERNLEVSIGSDGTVTVT